MKKQNEQKFRCWSYWYETEDMCFTDEFVRYIEIYKSYDRVMWISLFQWPTIWFTMLFAGVDNYSMMWLLPFVLCLVMVFILFFATKRLEFPKNIYRKRQEEL